MLFSVHRVIRTLTAVVLLSSVGNNSLANAVEHDVGQGDQRRATVPTDFWEETNPRPATTSRLRGGGDEHRRLQVENLAVLILPTRFSNPLTSFFRFGQKVPMFAPSQVDTVKWNNDWGKWNLFKNDDGTYGIRIRGF